MTNRIRQHYFFLKIHMKTCSERIFQTKEASICGFTKIDYAVITNLRIVFKI